MSDSSGEVTVDGGVNAQVKYLEADICRPHPTHIYTWVLICSSNVDELSSFLRLLKEELSIRSMLRRDDRM